MRRWTPWLGALALAAGLGVACSSSFTQADAPAPGDPTDGGADADAGSPGRGCTKPTLIEDPSAKPEASCGSGGATVSLSSDVSHCGACNHACALPGACTDGTCTATVVLASTPVVNALVVGDNAYVVDPMGRVLSGKTTATGAVALARPQVPQGGVRRMFADDTWLYLNTSAGAERSGLREGAYEPLPGAANGVLALGTTHYFYASSLGIEQRTKDGRLVVTAPFVGATGVVADGDRAYWVAVANEIASLYGPFPNATVLTSGPSIESPAVDADHIYYADVQRRLIQRVSRAGGAAQSVASELSPKVGTLALDGDYVYWTADRPGEGGWSLMRASKCGGVPIALAKAQPPLGLLSFNSTHVFVARLSAPAAQLTAISK